METWTVTSLPAIPPASWIESDTELGVQFRCRYLGIVAVENGSQL
jgi:hypothetical protein